MLSNVHQDGQSGLRSVSAQIIRSLGQVQEAEVFVWLKFGKERECLDNVLNYSFKKNTFNKIFA